MYKAKFGFVTGGVGSVEENDPLPKNKITDDLYEKGYLDLAEQSTDNSDEQENQDTEYETKALDPKPKNKSNK